MGRGATAEEWGMRSLAAYLRTHFPDVPVHHLPQGCQHQSSIASCPVDIH
ncbi:MAG TPA: hypothetical protein VFX49_15655 [Chloroflexota bacterium]|nr:hypothetical protein [Chloroflexota bacterium]